MSLDALAAIGLTPTATAAAPTPAPAPETQPGIFDGVLDSVSALNGDLNAADRATQSLALGNLDNLQTVMMQAEQTRLEFELALQVRNKLLDAYQELMRLQV
jgi:flagellar hook-basal body complex protein FliE